MLANLTELSHPVTRIRAGFRSRLILLNGFVDQFPAQSAKLAGSKISMIMVLVQLAFFSLCNGSRRKVRTASCSRLCYCAIARGLGPSLKQSRQPPNLVRVTLVPPPVSIVFAIEARLDSSFNIGAGE